MERVTPIYLHPVFRFSNATWILSYYGYIDQWKLILTRLNTLTKKLWEEHEIAFMNYGRNLKRDIYIETRAASSIQTLIADKKLFNLMLLERDNSNYKLNSILMSLNSNQELVMHQSSENTKDIVLYVWENDEASCILPSLECIKHKKKAIVLNQSQTSNLIKFLSEKMNWNAVSIKWINKVIQMKLAFSPVIKIEVTFDK